MLGYYSSIYLHKNIHFLELEFEPDACWIQGTLDNTILILNKFIVNWINYEIINKILNC